MELKHVLSKPRILITLTRSDNDSNYSAYLNARIVRLDKIESKIRKIKKQSKPNVGYNPRIKILRPSILQTTKNTRRNEATTAVSFSKGRDKKLGNRIEIKRKKHSKESNKNKYNLDLDTNESDYQILKDTGEQQARSTKTCNSNLNQNYQHIKPEIIRDGSSHWIGSKNFNLSQSNNKLTEIALFKILNKKSIFSKFLLNILRIKKINPKNQPTFPSKYNKRKKNKKRRPRHKNSMECFIQKYILNKNPCERDETKINKYEPSVSNNSRAKCYKTRCVTSPPQLNLNLSDVVCNSLSKRKSESYALNNNKASNIGKTESKELFLPLSCLINKAKHINRNSFDLIQSTLKKSNSAEFTINNYEKNVQKFEKTSLLKRYHLISLSDLDMTNQNHNFDGNCSKCDQILNDLMSRNQKLNSDENNLQENVSNQTDKVSNEYYISDCLPSIEESNDDKDAIRSKDKEKINDELNITSIRSNRYKTLNAQVGIPIVQQITNCGCFQNSNGNSSTSVSDVYDHKGQKVSSLEVNNSSNNSIIYTASIFDYETYRKSNRYMMVHCNDCDLICIVQPIKND